MASRMATLAAVKPKRCQGVKSTKAARSIREKVCVVSEEENAVVIAARILQLPVLVARVTRARRKAEVRRWL